jgi:NAD+ kinase
MLDTSATISLQKAPFVIKVVKGYNHSFSETLRTKLMWGADKRE